MSQNIPPRQSVRTPAVELLGKTNTGSATAASRPSWALLRQSWEPREESLLIDWIGIPCRLETLGRDYGGEGVEHFYKAS